MHVNAIDWTTAPLAPSARQIAANSLGAKRRRSAHISAIGHAHIDTAGNGHR
jgi:hypothetical protein